MTKDVVTVGPEATVREIATLLVNRRISAIPVVAQDNHLVGIVSQTDLGHRSETGTEKKRKWWLAVFVGVDEQAREYTKSHGLRARDVMTRHVLTVAPDTSLAEVADVLDTQRVRRLPVLKDGRLVGIISRSDLVRKLAEAIPSRPVAGPQDGQIQQAIWQEIKAQPWLSATMINITVKDGVVELFGALDSAAQRQALRVLIENVPGVQRVEGNLSLLPAMTI
jgi:CBS domain-containing protein